MTWNLKSRYQKGDTIIEVLIAVAIVSSVLAISYATMNRNLQTMRDNQERTEAAKFAQGQVEALKQAWSTTAGQASIITRRTGPFCISSGLAVPSGTGTVNPVIASDPFANYVASCRSGLYVFGIRYNSGTGVYTVFSRWDQLGTEGGRGEIVMAYRLQ